MAITRRQFIRRTGLTAGGALLGSGLFTHPLVRQAFALTGNRYFIVLFLDGGNDGLNTVSPISGPLRAPYELARKDPNVSNGGLQLKPPINGGDITNLLPIGNDPGTGSLLGIHPGFYGLSDTVLEPGHAGYGGLKALYDAGMVAVIQGVGYPDYNLSHDESRTIWQTANPGYDTNFSSTGWVGRHLAGAFGGSDIPAVMIEDGIPKEFRQFNTSVLAIRRLSRFEFPHDNTYPGDIGAKDTAFAALYDAAAASATNPMSLIGTAGTATFEGTVSYPDAHEEYLNDRASWADGYDNDGSVGSINRTLARDLREVAKIIYAQERTPAISGIGARYFRVSNGGYDTHSDQRSNDTDGQHYALHSEVGASLKHFFDDLADMDAALPDRVAVLVWSEFSRRIPQNENGTDHGSQGPVFVIGGKVNGGVYGRHPNIANADLDGQGNTVYRQTAGHTFRSTDIRDVYGSILKQYLLMNPANISPAILPVDGGNPDDYWTSPNFDLRRGLATGGDPLLFNP